MKNSCWARAGASGNSSARENEIAENFPSANLRHSRPSSLPFTEEFPSPFSSCSIMIAVARTCRRNGKCTCRPSSAILFQVSAICRASFRKGTLRIHRANAWSRLLGSRSFRGAKSILCNSFITLWERCVQMCLLHKYLAASFSWIASLFTLGKSYTWIKFDDLFKWYPRNWTADYLNAKPDNRVPWFIFDSFQRLGFLWYPIYLDHRNNNLSNIEQWNITAIFNISKIRIRNKNEIGKLMNAIVDY